MLAIDPPGLLLDYSQQRPLTRQEECPEDQHGDVVAEHEVVDDAAVDYYEALKDSDHRNAPQPCLHAHLFLLEHTAVSNILGIYYNDTYNIYYKLASIGSALPLKHITQKSRYKYNIRINAYRETPEININA